MDPVIKAARMSPEDVVIALRDEGIWFEGVDWVERRRNETRTREANETRTREANETTKGQGSDSSTNSSTSTSPVLSTTTLQTTSSPPAIDTSKPTISRNSGSILSESASSRSIPSESSRIISPESSNTLASESSSPTSASKPVAPKLITTTVASVLDPPRLLLSTPHIPVTVKHLPQFSLQAFKLVWREACAPLYHCRCSICERAQTKLNEANAAASNAAGTENADPIQVDAIDDATKGIQVIPDRLSSPPLTGKSRFMNKMSESLARRLSLQDVWENRVYRQGFFPEEKEEFCHRLGLCQRRGLYLHEGLHRLELFHRLGLFHPLAQEEEEEELVEYDDYELDDYGTGEYEDYGSDFDSEYSDTPSRRRSVSPKRQRSLSPIRHRSRSPAASRRFSRSISPLSRRSLSASERPRRAQTPAFSRTPPPSASRRASLRRILGPSRASLGPSRASPELEISQDQSRPQTPISRKRACEDAPSTPPKRARHERNLSGAESLSGSVSPKGISGLESPKESFGGELSVSGREERAIPEGYFPISEEEARALAIRRRERFGSGREPSISKDASESSSTPRKRSSEELDDALLGVKKRIRMSENGEPAT
ncbi:hypothetical protein C8J56DRAFT_1057773 [Mycena floridula]|nr:hypothetical protein C8J56DRAFT_1057773 [Mycena floridula]